MLRQRCKLSTGQDDGLHRKWIKRIDKEGEITFTDDETEALILLNHHWSELIKRQELHYLLPHLYDVTDS